jgi:hypothetical protein
MRGDLPGEAKLIAAFDLKEPGAEVTVAERVVYDWLETKGLPTFIVYTTMSFQNFKVVRWKSGTSKTFSRDEYVSFINNLCNSIFL